MADPNEKRELPDDMIDWCGYDGPQRFSLFSCGFVYLDTPELLSEAAFRKYNVDVNIKSYIPLEDSPYILVCCRVRKSMGEAFTAAMREMPDRMAICGHPDYAEQAKKIFAEMRYE